MLGLGQSQTQQVGNQLGVQPDQMNSALEAAVPLLLSQMGHNAQDPQQAASLSQAVEQHDGSAIDHVEQGNLPNLQDGQAIVGHVFGGQQQAAAQAVGQRAGIDPQMAMQILSMAAPLVMAYLSRNKGGSGAGGMGGNLGGLGSILGSVLGGGAGGGMAGGLPGGLGNILGGVLGGGMGGQQQGGMGDLGGMLGGLLGGQSAQAANQQGGVGLEPVNQNQPQGGNSLEDLIGMFGGSRR